MAEEMLSRTNKKWITVIAGAILIINTFASNNLVAFNKPVFGELSIMKIVAIVMIFGIVWVYMRKTE